MIINESFRIDSSRDEVADFFLNVEQLAQCMPGVEDVKEVGQNQYEGSMAVSVGPVRAAFQGTIELDPMQAPERFVATGRGKDRATGSSAVVEFTADLKELDDHTQVDVVADVAIRGRLGRFGTGVIQATASELVREFARCANETLQQQSAAPPGVDAGAVGSWPKATSQTAGRIVVRAFLTYIGSLFRRAWQAITRRSTEPTEESNAGH